MGQDSARLEVQKTLATVLRLGSPEYTMLRYFAVRALAQLPSLNETTTGALVDAARAGEPEIVRSAALETLARNAVELSGHRAALLGIAQRSDSTQVQLAALRLLADLGAQEAVGVAGGLVENADSPAVLQKVAYALSRIESEDAVSLLVNLAAREPTAELAMALLRDGDRELLTRVVERRLQTEQDDAVRAVLEELAASVTARATSVSG
jgi:hypothetical protein